MKKLFFALLSTLASATLLTADVVLTEEIDQGGQKAQMVLKMKDDKIRVDMGPEVSTIIDLGGKNMLTLSHAGKQAIEINAAMLQAIAAATKAQGAEATQGEGELKPLNKTEEIDGYTTELFTTTQMGGAMEITLWVAKNHPAEKLYLDTITKRDTALKESGMTDNLGVTPIRPAGVPLKSQVKTGGQTITNRFVSIEEKDLPASDFQRPEGYQTMQAPQIPQPVAP